MAGEELRAVEVYRNLVQDLLDRAAEVKTDGGIEPPLNEADLGDAAQRIQQSKEEALKDQNQQAHYAAVETAFREKFYDLLATTSIDDPAFIQIWNLLDIVSIFSDEEQCEPGLIFWLIEELLDSQTIDGCRKVFDYLESRRERNTAKHFKQKNLIILRSCNELLRRLSRAEDTVFCGRVFIYLFQSFPLGDKSSVNLRGEYHTENVTSFDELPKPQETDDNAMDVDMKEPESGTAAEGEQKPDQPTKEASAADASKDGSQTPKSQQQKKGEKEGTAPLSVDALYPIFWSLQANFSSPTRLFDPQHFASFKSGLQATLATFQRLNTDLEIRVMSKGNDESRRGLKRSRVGDGSETTNSFNPKYLTSRDLFELEINDIAFRRHILVQALILLDFVLSLTPKAKTKLADSTNKSVLYNFTLGDEDAKWAAQTKASIASYLQQGTEGKFYYRMVDTVLTRDKNWVRWKAEACPPIQRDPVSIQDYLDTQSSAVKVSANKRLRPAPLGSLDLTFLKEDTNLGGMDRLKAPERFQNPAVDSYMRGIADDEFNFDMAQSQEEKDEAAKSKDSKTWRTLRLASRNKLNLLDKIEDGKNLKILFETPEAPENVPKSQTEVPNGTSSSEAPTKEEKDESSKNNLAISDETMAEG